MKHLRHISPLSGLLLTGIMCLGTNLSAQTTTWKQLDLNQKFERLRINYRKDLTMEDSLYHSLPEAEWKQLYQRRIDTYHDIRYEDDSIINTIYNYYKYTANIPRYQYDSLLIKSSEFYRQTRDPFITEHLISFALPQYNKLEDKEHLFQCNAVMGLALTQIAHEGEHNEYLHAFEYLNLAADWGIAHYKDFAFSDSYDYLTRVYQELLQVRWLELRKVTLDDCYNRYLELQKLDQWMKNNPSAQNVSERIRSRVTSTYFDYEYNMIDFMMNEKSPYYANSEARLLAKFMKKHHDLKRQLWNENPIFDYKITPRFEVLYYQNLHFTGLYTPLESFRAIDSIYHELRKQPKLHNNIAELIEYINTAVFFMDLTDEMDPGTKQGIATAYLRDLIEYAKLGRKIRRQSRFYDQMETLITNPHFYHHLNNDNRHDIIINVLVKTDAETYAHSTLVAWIAWNLMETTINKHPSLLLGTLGCNTIKQVQENKTKLHEYIWNACLIHDLGLTRMAPTTNRHYRTMTSHEMQLLRRHSPNGAAIINISPSGMRYYDIIQGHHKWYNGKGYPEAFDNISSPYRIMLDMLTIADFLEGGSDVPYEGGLRGFDARLETLKTMAGKQFNPELVKMIVEEDNLTVRLRNLCDEGQLRSRYTVYKEYSD